MKLAKHTLYGSLVHYATALASPTGVARAALRCALLDDGCYRAMLIIGNIGSGRKTQWWYVVEQGQEVCIVRSNRIHDLCDIVYASPEIVQLPLKVQREARLCPSDIEQYQ